MRYNFGIKRSRSVQFRFNFGIRGWCRDHSMCILYLGVFLISAKPLTTENTENKTTPKICKITVMAWIRGCCVPPTQHPLHEYWTKAGFLTKVTYWSRPSSDSNRSAGETCGKVRIMIYYRTCLVFFFFCLTWTVAFIWVRLMCDLSLDKVRLKCASG